MVTRHKREEAWLRYTTRLNEWTMDVTKSRLRLNEHNCFRYFPAYRIADLVANRLRPHNCPLPACLPFCCTRMCSGRTTYEYHVLLHAHTHFSNNLSHSW